MTDRINKVNKNHNYTGILTKLIVLNGKKKIGNGYKTFYYNKKGKMFQAVDLFDDKGPLEDGFYTLVYVNESDRLVVVNRSIH